MSLGKQMPSVALNTWEGPWAGSTRLLCLKQLLTQQGAGTPEWFCRQCLEVSLGDHHRWWLRTQQSRGLSNHLCINSTNVGWWGIICKTLLQIWQWTRQTFLDLSRKSHHSQKWETLGVRRGDKWQEEEGKMEEMGDITRSSKLIYHIWLPKNSPVIRP